MRPVRAGLALSALLLALTASQASATIHPLSCSEKSNAPAGTPAATQDPPGLTNPPLNPALHDYGPDNSHAVNAQPIVAQFSNSTTNDTSHSFKPPGC